MDTRKEISTNREKSFEIKLTNQKQQAVNVGVIEHMYRGESVSCLCVDVHHSAAEMKKLKLTLLKT